MENCQLLLLGREGKKKVLGNFLCAGRVEKGTQKRRLHFLGKAMEMRHVSIVVREASHFGGPDREMEITESPNNPIAPIRLKTQKKRKERRRGSSPTKTT